jgi:predicted nucleic acid-binding protein
VSPNGYKYLLDADVIIRIHARKDSAEIYGGLVTFAAEGYVKTVRQALDEVKKFEPQYAIIKPHRDKFQIPTEEQYSADVSRHIEYLGRNAGYLWPQTGGKNPDPADPWLVAVASCYGYTLVTNESPRKQKRIPAACRLSDSSCRCIRGPHFLLETGLVEKAEPEHIDPEGFFGGQ